MVSHEMQNYKEDIMINKKELKKSLRMHDVSVQRIAEEANVSVSTVYRWLADPDKMNVGTVELIKNLTGMNKAEFTSIFYPEIVA